MKLIRKYNDFLKSINESTISTPETVERENTDGYRSTQDLNDDDSSNLIDSQEDLIDDQPEDLQDDLNDDVEEGSDEEDEAGEYKGYTLMKELASQLGTKVENNQINYKGVVINYFSETEKFHIGRNKFETPGEVIEFLEKK